jgi:hypothetical protein
MEVFRAVSAAAALAAMLGSLPAQAQVTVPVCDGLSLYANGVRTGLCKNLSRTNQNLWVCELTTDNPDVHLTFNAPAQGVAATSFHVTVRTPRANPTCQGHSILTGSYPSVPGNALRRAPMQPAVVCQVNIDDYVQRLIALPQMAPDGHNRVQTAILSAQLAGRVTPIIQGDYIGTAAAQGC